MSRHAILLLYIAGGLVLGVGAFFLTVYFWPWGDIILIVAGLLLMVRAFRILRRVRRPTP